jgi:hypothetical protein
MIGTMWLLSKLNDRTFLVAEFNPGLLIYAVRIAYNFRGPRFHTADSGCGAPGLAIQNAGTNKMVKTLVPIKIETKWVEAGVSFQPRSYPHYLNDRTFLVAEFNPGLLIYAVRIAYNFR